jgi:hypothetical protein
MEVRAGDAVNNVSDWLCPPQQDAFPQYLFRSPDEISDRSHTNLHHPESTIKIGSVKNLRLALSILPVVSNSSPVQHAGNSGDIGAPIRRYRNSLALRIPAP